MAVLANFNVPALYVSKTRNMLGQHWANHLQRSAKVPTRFPSVGPAHCAAELPILQHVYPALGQ